MFRTLQPSNKQIGKLAQLVSSINNKINVIIAARDTLITTVYQVNAVVYTTKAVLKEVCYNNIILVVLSDIRALRKSLVTLPTSLRGLARGVKNLTRSLTNTITTLVLVSIYRSYSSSSQSTYSTYYTTLLATQSLSSLSSPLP